MLDKKKTDKPAVIMVSKSLAVKHRPSKWGHAVGHSDVIDQLKGMLKLQKVPSVLLFKGPPGSGKTTLARLFARYINCATGNACGECPSCKYTLDAHPDACEYNIADQELRGIDGTKILKKNASYNPRFKLRVMILDEAHAATPQWYQSMLKPLEEPPARTLWILCTSNPEKLPTAIMSRCTQLNLARISKDDISKRLKSIAKLESMELGKKGDELLNMMAEYSGGQVRDAIGMLESVLFAQAGGDSKNMKDVVTRFAASLEGSIEKQAVKFLYYMLTKSVKGMLKAVSEAGNIRFLISKVRWVVQYEIDAYAGIAEYQTYAVKEMKKFFKEKGLTFKLREMFEIQQLLTDIEMTLNTGSIDERIVFTTRSANWIVAHKEDSNG